MSPSVTLIVITSDSHRHNHVVSFVAAISVMTDDNVMTAENVMIEGSLTTDSVSVLTVS